MKTAVMLSREGAYRLIDDYIPAGMMISREECAHLMMLAVAVACNDQEAEPDLERDRR